MTANVDPDQTHSLPQQVKGITATTNRVNALHPSQSAGQQASSQVATVTHWFRYAGGNAKNTAPVLCNPKWTTVRLSLRATAI